MKRSKSVSFAEAGVMDVTGKKGAKGWWTVHLHFLSRATPITVVTGKGRSFTEAFDKASELLTREVSR